MPPLTKSLAVSKALQQVHLYAPRDAIHEIEADLAGELERLVCLFSDDHLLPARVEAELYAGTSA